MDSFRWVFSAKLWIPKREDILLALSLIQAEEKERIMKYMFQRDAKASLIGRLMIRKAVSGATGISWSDILLKRTNKGRPYIFSPVSNSTIKYFDFNVSHQGDVIVLAAERLGANIGVDVMKVEKASKKNVPEFFRLMKRQFTDEEWATIYKFTYEESQLKAFYRNWCLKESFVKSLGVGISYNLQSLSFTVKSELELGRIIYNTELKIDGKVQDKWHFEETMLDSDHIVAVAYPSEQKHSLKSVAFHWLNFNDLVKNSSEVIPPDELACDEFLAKESHP